MAATDSMLVSGDGRAVPTRDELDAANAVIGKATEPVNYLEMVLEQLAREEEFPLSAEQAWSLTHFARYMQVDGEALIAWGRTIERAAETLYECGIESGAEGGAS